MHPSNAHWSKELLLAQVERLEPAFNSSSGLQCRPLTAPGCRILTLLQASILALCPTWAKLLEALNVQAPVQTVVCTAAPILPQIGAPSQLVYHRCPARTATFMARVPVCQRSPVGLIPAKRGDKSTPAHHPLSTRDGLGADRWRCVSARQTSVYLHVSPWYLLWERQVKYSSFYFLYICITTDARS